MDQRFGQIVVLVYREPDWDRFDVFPKDLVFFYGGFFGAAAVFSGRGGGEVPFYVTGSADEGDVVQIDYLSQISLISCRR